MTAKNRRKRAKEQRTREPLCRGGAVTNATAQRPHQTYPLTLEIWRFSDLGSALFWTWTALDSSIACGKIECGEHGSQFMRRLRAFLALVAPVSRILAA